MPNYFGVNAPGQGKAAQKKLVFGLPGNPVAALVSFHLLVRPALLKMAGVPDPQPRFLIARLARACHKKHGRLEWARGALTMDESGVWTATPTAGQESHMLSGLAAADCLIEFPLESKTLDAGAHVRVMLLDPIPIFFSSCSCS